MFNDKSILSFIKGYYAKLELLNTHLIYTHVLRFYDGDNSQ